MKANRESGVPYPTDGEIDIETGEPIVPTVNDSLIEAFRIPPHKLPNEDGIDGPDIDEGEEPGEVGN